jgi:hypothetical protein
LEANKPVETQPNVAEVEAQTERERKLDDAVWIGEQLSKRTLPPELAALFEEHNRTEAVAAMDAIQLSIHSMVEDNIRKRIAGSAPVVGAMANMQREAIRKAFGLKR